MSAFGGTTTGTCSLNSTPLTPELFFKECVVVTQVDYHWSYLTCRETIAYAADLLMHESTAGG